MTYIMYIETNSLSSNSDPWSPTYTHCGVYTQPCLLETFPKMNPVYTPIPLTPSYSANSAM